MSHRTEAANFTLRVGRQHASACGVAFVAAFGDTLSGDLARLQVRRRVQRAFPGMSSKNVEELIEELLTP